jgi:hypothetical protein
MSIISKSIIGISLLLSLSPLSAQEKKIIKSHTIFINLDSKYIVNGHSSINKDTTSASFGIYINGFQSKEKRKKITKDYRNGKIKENSVGLPTFSTNFYCFNRKPERVITIDTIKYITEEQYSKNNSLMSRSNPMFIIHKLKDGTYLRWEVFTMGDE